MFFGHLCKHLLQSLRFSDMLLTFLGLWRWSYAIIIKPLKTIFSLSKSLIRDCSYAARSAQIWLNALYFVHSCAAPIWSFDVFLFTRSWIQADVVMVPQTQTNCESFYFIFSYFTSDVADSESSYQYRSRLYGVNLDHVHICCYQGSVSG